jgi:hypothetical protein
MRSRPNRIERVRRTAVIVAITSSWTPCVQGLVGTVIMDGAQSDRPDLDLFLTRSSVDGTVKPS